MWASHVITTLFARVMSYRARIDDAQVEMLARSETLPSVKAMGG